MVNRLVYFSVTARIVTGHLLLRITYEIEYPEVKVAFLSHLQDFPLKICNHTSATVGHMPYHDNTLAKLTRGRDYSITNSSPDDENFSPDEYNEVWGISESEPKARHRQCVFCPTEYIAVGGRSSRNSSGALIITVYHNFGTGKQPGSEPWDPENLNWYHLVGTQNPHKTRIIEFPKGSIIDAFDGKDTTKLDYVI